MRFASPALALARRTLLTTWLATVAVLAVACGGGGGSDDAGDDDQTVQPGDTLIVSPATATLTIANGAPVDQAYTATLHHESGVEVDVTDRVTFAIQESAIGYVSGDTLTATGAGRGTMTGTLEGIQGTAVVEVYRKDIRVEDPAPANAADLFDAATDDPARVATIVYPSDRTIVPQNLGDFDVHWTDGSGSDLFEVRMQTYYADVRVFVTGDASVGTWIAFLLAEWNVIARSELSATITVSVRGLTQADPTTASHASIQVFTSREDIEGGIYYWTAASAGGSAVGIWRHDMGAADQPSESFYTQTEAGRCVACHALSRDGTKMAVTYDGGNGSSTVVDVASRTAAIPPATQYWNFAAFTPDASELLVATQGTLTMRSPADGSVIATVPTSGYASHPDVSPQGDMFAYVRVGTPGQDWHFTGGTISLMTYDQANHTFGPETPLVTSTENNYYPSFSPDGQWILFNKSNNDAYDDPDAELWVVKTDGTVGPLKLDAANIGAGLTNSWARWAPFEGSFGQDAERIYWLTFSSKRDFGVRLVGAGRPQIWMTPFFPDRAATGADPTAPAFRLPFQDLNSSNHIAQWTERVVPVN